MKTLSGISWVAVLAAGAILDPSPAQAQLPVSPDLVVTAVEAPADSQFIIVFSDAGTGATDYLVEHTPDLGDGTAWTVDNAAVITPLGGGNFRATTQRQGAFGAYRIVAYHAGAALTAQFASPTVELEEGAGTYHMLVTFSRPFTGTLNYSVEGPASGAVGPLPGSVTVNNATTARIALQLGDNLTVDELSFLSLIITAGDGLGTGRFILQCPPPPPSTAEVELMNNP